MTDPTVVDRGGPDDTAWSLAVRADGVVEASRRVPYDGVFRVSPEERGYVSYRKNSMFNLTAREVVRRYCATSDTGRGFGELVDAVQVALADVQADTDDEDSGRPEPTRHEPADFGGGETTGVQDL